MFFIGKDNSFITYFNKTQSFSKKNYNLFSNPFSKIVSIIDEPKDMTDTYINIEELL